MRFGPEQIERRVKGLPTYLVHGSHQKLNSLYFYLFLKILLQFHSFHQLNSNHRQFLQKHNPQFSVIVIRKVCPLTILPVFENTFQRSFRVGMNDVINDEDRSKDIYSCFQADKYTYLSIIVLSGY